MTWTCIQQTGPARSASGRSKPIVAPPRRPLRLPGRSARNFPRASRPSSTSEEMETAAGWLSHLPTLAPSAVRTVRNSAKPP
eukprot:2605174-Alexandrium_andersonii.AAC.1